MCPPFESYPGCHEYPIEFLVVLGLLALFVWMYAQRVQEK